MTFQQRQISTMYIRVPHSAYDNIGFIIVECRFDKLLPNFLTFYTKTILLMLKFPIPTNIIRYNGGFMIYHRGDVHGGGTNIRPNFP